MSDHRLIRRLSRPRTFTRLILTVERLPSSDAAGSGGDTLSLSNGHQGGET